MEGQSFLGKDKSSSRKYIYGARSRADNMYEVSRAVLDSQYIYIRHYFPHYPYIQPGYIFSDRKRSFRELRKLKEQNLLKGEALDMWLPKGEEELYDLHQDPQELHNLAKSSEYQKIKSRMRQALHNWVEEFHDTGFLLEPEMMIRAEGSTPYQMAYTSDEYNISKVLEAAEMVGKANKEMIIEKLESKDSGVRFWAVMAMQALNKKDNATAASLKPLLNDPSPTVQVAVAETLCHWNQCDNALPVLKRWVQDDRPWLVLYAARSIELIGVKAKPLVPVLYEVLDKYAAPEDAGRRYKDFNFSAFTSWSLEWALHHCGEDIDIFRVDMI
jgi:N-sulfoglucosamine sulfohydrolase